MNRLVRESNTRKLSVTYTEVQRHTKGLLRNDTAVLVDGVAKELLGIVNDVALNVSHQTFQVNSSIWWNADMTFSVTPSDVFDDNICWAW